MRIWLFLVAVLAVRTATAQCVSGDCSNGFGTKKYRDGSTYTGDFSHGIPEGHGTYTYPDGRTIRAVFHNGLPQKEILLPETTTGCISGNCQNGKGEYIDPQGNHYAGYFRNGKFHGKGLCRYKDGSVYSGSWRDGKPDGKGVWRRKGAMRKGIWRNGKLIGQAAIQEQPVRKKSNTYYIIIGIENYPKVDMLDYAVDDAFAFRDFIIRSQGPVDDNICLLTDDKATRNGILNTMSTVAQKAGPQDSIVLFYSGHGIRNALLPVESDGTADLLSYYDLGTYLLRAPAHITAFIDACNDTITTPQSNFSSDPRLHVLLSSFPGQKAHENDAIKGGVFTHYLIEGLNGLADSNQDGCVDFDEISDYVQSNVYNFTNGAQKPTSIASTDKCSALIGRHK